MKDDVNKEATEQVTEDTPSESTEEVAEKDLYDEVTDRADGGFGSSDK